MYQNFQKWLKSFHCDRVIKVIETAWLFWNAVASRPNYNYCHYHRILLNRCTVLKLRRNFTTKLEVLREHKPPPIWSVIRIATKIVSLGRWAMPYPLPGLPLQKISSKSVYKFASNPTDRQTNRQTDRTKNITSFFGGGNNRVAQMIDVELQWSIVSRNLKQ